MHSPPSLPSLRETIQTHGLDAKKSLGQHFLLDMNITRKIASLAQAHMNDLIIEVGPGPGGLTRALLEQGATLITIERDKRCLDILAELQTAWPGKLNIQSEDALSTDYQKLISASKPVKFVSNLPYNISTELLVRWLTLPSGHWSRMTLMFQKEVADRILASPGTKTYGRLSILSQTASIPVRGYNLPARAFTPPPKVDSTVVNFTPPESAFPALPTLESLTRAAFSQRRKMVRSSLKSLLNNALDPYLEQAGILPTQRAEDIDIEKYQKLACLIAAKQQT